MQSGGIPTAWSEADDTIGNLVSGLLAAASSFGCASSSGARTIPPAPAGGAGGAVIGETPTPEETVGFIRTAVTVISQLWPPSEDQATNDASAQALQHVLFDSANELLRVLWLFVVPPRNPWISTSTFASGHDVKAAAFRAIKATALICSRDETLAFMFTQSVSAERGMHSITRCLCSAASTGEARRAAAELLLVLTLQLHMTEIRLSGVNGGNGASGGGASSGGGGDLVDVAVLISTSLAEPEAEIRSFMLAAVQCCIVERGADDGVIQSLCTSPVLSALLRLMASDDAQDVRCVAALALYALLSAIPATVLSSSRDGSGSGSGGGALVIINCTASDYLSVAEATVSRLQLLLSPISSSSSSSASSPLMAASSPNTSSGGANFVDPQLAAAEEEIAALLQVLDGVTRAAAAVGNEQVFVAFRQRSIARTMLQRGIQQYRPGVCLQLLRCVRSMLERAPPYASQAPQLCDATTMTSLFKLSLAFPPAPRQVATNINNDEAVSAALETQLVMGCILTFSAETRAHAVQDLSKTVPMFATVLRERSVAHLANSPLSYFAGIELRDEYHALLNDDSLSALRWSPDGIVADPDCARMILDGQQLRALPRTGGGGGGGSGSLQQQHLTSNRLEVTEHWRSCNMVDRHNVPEEVQMRRASLLVALVRFVVDSVLQALCEVALANAGGGDSTRNSRQQSSSPQRSNNYNYSPSGGGGGAGGKALLSASMTDITATSGMEALLDTLPRDENEAFITDHSPESDSSPHQHYRGNSNNASRFLQPHRALLMQGSSTTSGDPEASARKVLQQVNSSLYSEFDACIRLVLHYAEHFKPAGTGSGTGSGSGSGSGGPSAAKTTGQHRFARDSNNPHLRVRRSSSDKSSKLTNPWEVKKVQPYDPRAWHIDAVQEGDLFYFSLQVASLNANVLDAIVAKARSHYIEIKKVLTVTPNTALNRRHFLLEMVTSVMPNVIALLIKLQKIVATQGEGHVLTALTLCPDLQHHPLLPSTQQQTPQQRAAVAAKTSSSAAAAAGAESSSSAEDKIIDCGNVVGVVDFLMQYFASKMYAMGMPSSKAGQLAQQQAAAKQEQQRQQQAASAGGVNSNANNNNANNSGASPAQLPRVDSQGSSLGGFAGANSAQSPFGLSDDMIVRNLRGFGGGGEDDI